MEFPNSKRVIWFILHSAALVLAFALANSSAQAEGDDPEPEPVTCTKDIQPLLQVKCGRCHGASHQQGIPHFAESYAETQVPSGGHQTHCPGKTVGACIGDAVAIQRRSGQDSPWCRTFNLPFHRETWVCLDDGERALVAQWVADGQLE